MKLKCLAPLLVAALTLLNSCAKKEFVEGKVFAGGIKVDEDTLNLGRTTYIEYCISCHGANGDGNGVASKGLNPPPRNFTQGLYKFGLVADSGLPTDEDFARIIRHGLKGSAMLNWDISDERLNAVIQYIKTFAPDKWEGADKTVGVPLVASKDPYKGGHEQFAIEKGKQVYHITGACFSCHRAYVTKAELSELNQKVNNAPLTEFDPEMYKIKGQPSEYNYLATPPDFTYHEIKSASTVEEIYLRINAGVTGTAMAAWKGALEDDEIWAVAYYVHSLTELKQDFNARKAFMEKLEAQ